MACAVRDLANARAVRDEDRNLDVPPYPYEEEHDGVPAQGLRRGVDGVGEGRMEWTRGRRGRGGGGIEGRWRVRARAKEGGGEGVDGVDAGGEGERLKEGGGRGG